jgi:hypothetical protein
MLRLKTATGMVAGEATAAARAAVVWGVNSIVAPVGWFQAWIHKDGESMVPKYTFYETKNYT